jgi:hypothetical protein
MFLVFFSAVTSIILGHLFNKIKDKFDNFMAFTFKKIYMSITVSLPGKATYYATIIRNYFRGRKLKKHQLFRQTVYNESAITRQTVRTYSYFLLFWLSISFYFLLIVLGSLNDLFESSFELGILSTTPIYLFQFMWMLASLKSDKLIKSRGRIRITSYSNGRETAG